MDLFSLNREKNLNNNSPLADRLRPKSIDDFFGQEHILGPGKHLRRLIQSGRVYSMIFYGPPGTGKTTLANIISKEVNYEFESLSAVSSGKKDIEKVVQIAEDNLGIYNKKTLLFIDEIHRFNKAQQDALLPHVENGLLTLIGATTENPYINVNKALISRCQIIELKSLNYEDIKKIIMRALTEDKLVLERNIELNDDALDYLIRASNGDARVALNSLEIAALTSSGNIISEDDMRESVLIRTARYDRDGNDHYDTISAFIKSIRASDPDASLYYLARMIEAGEDPLFIGRRLIISASEDIGLADPRAMMIANSAYFAVQNIGMPEGRIPLAEASLYLALAPKSDSSYKGIDCALSYIKEDTYRPISNHIRDSHYWGADKLGVKGYENPHNTGGYTDQSVLPEGMDDAEFYKGKKSGIEKDLLEDYKTRKEEYRKRK